MFELKRSSRNKITTLLNPTAKTFLEEAVYANKPVKILGGMQDWTLYKVLSSIKCQIEKCDYLSSLTYKLKVGYTVAKPELNGALRINNELKPNFSFSNKKVLFPEFMSHIKEYLWNQRLGTLYMQATPIQNFTSYILPLKFLKGFSPASDPYYWIGSGNQFVGLHNDPQRNIMAMFTGKKNIILIPPTELHNIYPAPFDKRVGGVMPSLVDVFNPNLEKFPLYEKAMEKSLVFDLNPGEILYMPPLWWHAVQSVDLNMSVNSWFYDGGAYEQLDTLYFPVQNLFKKLDHVNETKVCRERAYNIFTRALYQNNNINLNSKTDILVEKQAKEVKKIIETSNISSQQKKNWYRWVDIFVKYYLFRLKGDIFPSLDDTAFFDMIKRIRKRRLWPKLNIINFFKYFIISCIYKIKKKQRIHGLVPSFVDKERVGKNDLIVNIRPNEINAKIVINKLLCGVFIYYSEPPMIGTKVTIVIHLGNKEKVLISNKVAWKSSIIKGFGVKLKKIPKVLEEFLGNN